MDRCCLEKPQCRTNLAAECGTHHVRVRATAVVWVSGDNIKKAHCVCVSKTSQLLLCVVSLYRVSTSFMAHEVASLSELRAWQTHS